MFFVIVVGVFCIVGKVVFVVRIVVMVLCFGIVGY